MEILGYISSIFMGISLGLIGGGGSILTLPILVYLFALPPVVATGDTLFIVGITALFGGIQAIRKGLVDFKAGLIFAGPSLSLAEKHVKITFLNLKSLCHMAYKYT